MKTVIAIYETRGSHGYAQLFLQCASFILRCISHITPRYPATLVIMEKGGKGESPVDSNLDQARSPEQSGTETD